MMESKMRSRTGKRTPSTCGAIAALAFAADVVRADVIYVDDSSISGANDGTSWLDAFTDLQCALAIAQAGDEIRIAQGVYKPAPPGGDRNATFILVNGLLLQGGYAGIGAPDPDALDPTAFPTVLSGDLNGDDGPNFQNTGENAFNVLVADGVDDSTTMRGLTIRGGNANYDDASYADRRMYGGGITGINGAALTLIDCVVRDNRSHFGGGGGVRLQGLNATGCLFTANRTDFAAMSPAGALLISGAGAMLEACTFASNFAGNAGGAIVGGPLVLRQCRFLGNGSNESAGAMSTSGCLAIDTDFVGNGSYHGGAVSCANSTFINCRFLHNGGGCFSFANGAAVRSQGQVNLVNCLFSGNVGSLSTFFAAAEPNLIANCTFVGHQSRCAGSAISAGAGTTIVNTVAWDNHFDDNSPSTPNLVQANQISAAPGTVLAHNVIQGWTGALGGVGNHGNDPRFVDADGPDNIYGTADDDPRLLPNSPCIDTGDLAWLPPDTHDLDDDGDTDEPLPIDLDGLPRIVGENVDMGAFEFQGAPCRADLNSSGAVSVADLLLVIGGWGACASGVPCNADLDLNGVVNVWDLLEVILHWGACP